MDIIEFTETQLGIELSEWQKELLRKMYEAGPDAAIVYVKNNGRSNYLHILEMIKALAKENKNENV